MVVRYGCFVGKDDYEKMASADNGAWVKYEDYTELESELSIAKEGIKRMEKLLQEHQTYQTKQGDKT